MNHQLELMYCANLLFRFGISQLRERGLRVEQRLDSIGLQSDGLRKTTAMSFRCNNQTEVTGHTAATDIQVRKQEQCSAKKLRKGS